MARIYESRGPRAQLRGPQAGVGYQPVRAVDTSQRELEAGQRRLEQYSRAREFTERSAFDARRQQSEQGLAARGVTEEIGRSAVRFTLDDMSRVTRQALDNAQSDISAFSQFSETLTTFLQNTAQQRAKEQVELLTGEALLGNVEITDGQLFLRKEQETALNSAALSDTALANTVADKDVALANSIKNQSRPLRGWAAYGAAVGLAKRSAALAQPALQTFMSSKEATIPITKPDGSIELISPAEAGMSREPGVAGDPAEVAAAMRQGLQEFIKASGLSTIHPAILAEHVTPTILNIKSAIQSNRAAESRKRSEEDAKFAVRERIGHDFYDSKIWSNKESLFEWIQGRTTDLMIGANLPRPQAKDSNIRDLLNRIVVDRDRDGKLDLLEATQLRDNDPGTIGDFYRVEIEEARRKINDGIRADIQQNQIELDEGAKSLMADYDDRLMAGEDSLALRDEYIPALQTLAEAGSPLAREKIKELAQRGDANPYVTVAYKERIRRGDFPTAEELMEDRRRGTLSAADFNELMALLPTDVARQQVEDLNISGYILDKLVLKAGPDAGNFEVVRGIMGQRANQLAEEIALLLYNEAKQNPQVTNEQLRSILERQTDNYLTNDPRFRVNRDGTFETDITFRGNAPDPIRPSVPTATPNPQRPRPFVSPGALRQIESADSRSAAILADPNSTPLQRARALVNARDSQQRQAMRQTQAQSQTALPGVGMIGPAATALMDFIGNAEGGARQWEASNRGVAGDTQGGTPGLTNMTLAQIMQMQNAGDVNAVGRYQFVKDPLRETVAQLGLDPNTTRFTPEVQNQLFMARIQSGVRPKLRDYINGTGDDLTGALRDLSNEFAVVKPPGGGGGRYDGLAGNRASLHDSDAARLLRSLRAERMRAGFNLARSGTGLATVTQQFRGMDTSAGPDKGNLACVYAVNEVLKSSGVTPPWGNTNSVPEVVKSLRSGTGVEVNKPEPGAIAILRDNGNPPYPHIGIVQADGKIISNSSSRRKFDWVATEQEYTNYYGRSPLYFRLR